MVELTVVKLVPRLLRHVQQDLRKPILLPTNLYTWNTAHGALLASSDAGTVLIIGLMARQLWMRHGTWNIASSRRTVS